MLERLRDIGKPKRKAEIYLSNNEERLQRTEKKFYADKHAEFGVTKVYPAQLHQVILGFGGAFTEASASVFSALDEANQQMVLQHYFSADGCRYNLCRTHIQSCDFALGNYSYVSSKKDKALASFTIDRDRESLIPMMKEAYKLNPELEILASPWSPPAFMKSNKSMNFGGRLKKKYYGRWAEMMARYVAEMRVEGIPITRITVQNEPMATQTWDSCRYRADEEYLFAKEFLKPALADAGCEGVKVLVWDHNKDRVLDRIDAMFAEDGGVSADGIAFHWYTGDHFEALAEAAYRFPYHELILTEMCLEHFPEHKPEIYSAERYAHEMIGDFNAGMQGFIDWNLLLDSKGGPNHVGNFCNAPILANLDTGSVHIGLESSYIAHFSRFVRRGARRMVLSRESSAIEAVGFVNPDETRVAILLNRNDHGYGTKLVEGTQAIQLEIPAHSIITAVWA